MKPLEATDPRQVGPYTLVGRLGSGGMGAVYLGRSQRGRTAAVKVVRPDLARDDEFRDRFRREVAAARLVSGAFTAPVWDADSDAATPWMATAFVVGVSLQETVATRGPLPPSALRTLTAGLAEALVAVHSAKLIHRDLKPGNVLLALDGPRLIDFGISRAADGTAMTSTGSIIGSAPFMSPEQASGGTLAEASDVFSLGSTIAFAALGESVFGDGAAAAVLFRVVHTEPDLSGVPADLRELVSACLTKSPADRPTPRELADLVESSGHTIEPGSWLPAAVAADVIAVRSILTALPDPAPADAPDADAPTPTQLDASSLPRHLWPPPSGPSLPGSPPEPSSTGPSRRNLILGLAGGALAIGAGAAAWIGLTGEESPGDNSQGDSPGGDTVRRPSGDDVPEARLDWQVQQAAPAAQVIAAHGVVACVTLQHVWLLDNKGKTKWTVDSAAHSMGFSVQGPIPKNIATVDGDLLYVGGSSMDYPGLGRSMILAIDLTTGKAKWSATLERENLLGVMSLSGVQDGQVYLIGMGDGQERQNVGSGFHVWGVDLATKKTAWFYGSPSDLLYSAVPPKGKNALFAGTSKAVALDAEGKVSWSKSMKLHTAYAAGPHFVTMDVSGALVALNPADGKKVWSSKPGVLTASIRGDGIASNEDGSVLYTLFRDGDKSFSWSALDSASGEELWRTPLPAEPKGGQALGARILYADGNLYRMGSDCVLWAFDPKNGKPRWKHTGMRGTDPMKLAWHAGDGRLCVSDPTATTIASLAANGA